MDDMEISDEHTIKMIMKAMMMVGFSSSSFQPRCESSIIDSEKYLTVDILFEIFLRLPLKSIFKYRCVSKLWFSLLSNPTFISRVRVRFNSLIPWTLFYQFYTSVSTASLDPHFQFVCDRDGFSFRFLNYSDQFQYKESTLYFLASNNGLVLCSTTTVNQKRYFVCNPLTKKWVALVFPLRRPPYKVHEWVLNGFISCESSSSSLTSTSTYNVVRIPEFRHPSTNFDLEIYSSRTREWNIYTVSCRREVTMSYPFSSNVVTRNGVLYWIEGQNRIIAYDLNNSNHQCRLIDLPEDIREDDSRCLGVSEGFISYSQRRSGQLSVWVVEEDKFSRGWVWRLVHKIKLNDMLLPVKCDDWFKVDFLSGGARVNLKPIAFNPVDRNVLILSYKHEDWDTFVILGYNIRTRRITALKRYSYLYSCYRGVVFPFVLEPWPTKL